MAVGQCASKADGFAAGEADVGGLVEVEGAVAGGVALGGFLGAEGG